MTKLNRIPVEFIGMPTHHRARTQNPRRSGGGGVNVLTSEVPFEVPT